MVAIVLVVSVAGGVAPCAAVSVVFLAVQVVVVALEVPIAIVGVVISSVASGVAPFTSSVFRSLGTSLAFFSASRIFLAN